MLVGLLGSVNVAAVMGEEGEHEWWPAACAVGFTAYLSWPYARTTIICVKGDLYFA